MPRLIDHFSEARIKSDWRTLYRRYRFGRLKHHYYLWNRKHAPARVEAYDHLILSNCQPGHTVFFASAAYYLRELWPEITVVEMHPIVKTFYPDAIIADRPDIAAALPAPADNFAVVNNRADHWRNLDGMTELFQHYCRAMAPGCRFFYSFRDTQIHYNRLRYSFRDLLQTWLRDLEKIDLHLAWHNIEFGAPYLQGENPDTTNGNIKLWFSYQHPCWRVPT
jgi:hypothetical protein